MNRSVLIICLSLVLAVGALADPTAVYVSIAGRPVSIDPPAVVISDHLMLPAGFLSGHLGIAVTTGSTAGSWRLEAYGHALQVFKGRQQFVLDSTAMSAAQPAVVIDGRLYVPVEMISRSFGIIWGRREGNKGFDLLPPGAVVQDVRGGAHQDYYRLVFDMSRPSPYWQAKSNGELVIDIPPPEVLPADWGALRLFTFEDPMKPKVTAKRTDDNWTRLTVSFDNGGQPSLISLGNPSRIIADIPRLKPLNATPVEPVEPLPKKAPALPPKVATPWTVRHFTTARGLVRVFVLIASPTAVRPATAGPTIRSLATVSKMAARASAPAAINGGHFDKCGAPLGMLVIDGEMIKHPMRNRTALGLTYDGKAIIGHQRFEGSLRIEGLPKLDLGGINASHWALARPMVYTRRWGNAVEGAGNKVRLVISGDGVVTRVEKTGLPVGIPGDGYVVSGGGEAGAMLATVAPGTRASVQLAAVPHWPNLRHAVGAGPQLVRDGEREMTHEEELFRLGPGRPCPRSAVGIDADGNLMFVAAEANIAKGLTLWELSSVMWKLGCRDAMALDGGGSTTVFFKGRVSNHPSDGAQRPVSNAILIYGIP